MTEPTPDDHNRPHPDDVWPDETVEVDANGVWLVIDGVVRRLGRVRTEESND